MKESFFKRWGHFAADVVLAILVFAWSAYTKQIVDERLASYVTSKELQTYKESHDKWAAEVLMQLRGDIARLESGQRDMNTKLDTLLLRPTQRAEFKPGISGGPFISDGNYFSDLLYRGNGIVTNILPFIQGPDDKIILR